jgi:uncharacterized protein (DUF1786 family)
MAWTAETTSRVKLLSVDIGTGTQDVFLLDTDLSIENGYKMVLPSPTLMIQRRLHQAARERRDVLLTGRLMGGGPSGWGAADHARAGLKVYATPVAARTLDDDLDAVRAQGITVLGEEDASALPDSVERVEMRDFDFGALQRAFAIFNVPLNDLAAVAVAVFDHGAAPAGVSDRKFRFDHLDRRIREQNRLSAFAWRAEDIPVELTRMQAVADSAKDLPCPLVVMDSAAAAILGATLDPAYPRHERNLVVNIGNMHTLAFRLGPKGIEGVFEHHTGFLDQAPLEGLLLRFAAGSLTNDVVYADKGHGALICEPTPLAMDHEDFNLIVTGPRRGMLAGSALKPYFAAPYGDMMLTGCFGLLRAAADLLPECRDTIMAALEGESASRSPWELV